MEPAHADVGAVFAVLPRGAALHLHDLHAVSVGVGVERLVVGVEVARPWRLPGAWDVGGGAAHEVDGSLALVVRHVPRIDIVSLEIEITLPKQTESVQQILKNTGDLRIQDSSRD